MYSLLRLALIVVLALAASAAELRGLAQKPEVADAIKVLDAWIDATVKQREQPGLSVGVVHDQELIWAKGYGYADVAKKIPATPQTLYRIASISKLFTSTAVMQLRDAGKLRLDDPVAQHLAWFKIRNVHPDGPAVTIRHLITHTSGLPREAMGVNWSDLKFPKREEMVRLIAEQETVFPAETEWKYSNLALSLAGEIVANASAQPWADYVDRNILRPLGMNSTRAIPEASLAGLSTGYGRRVPGRTRDIEPFVNIEAENPAGSLASNVEDLAKFISLQVGKGPARVLKASTIQEMHRVQWLRPDWRSGWGLGFSVRRVGEQVRVGHGGSLPGQRTQIEVAPAAKLGVIVLTNANDGDPGRYIEQAFTILNPAVARATEKPKDSSAPDPAWDKYTGTYTWKNSDVHVMVVGGQLTMVFPEADNPWDSRIILKPVKSPHMFRMDAAGPGTPPTGEMAKFEIGEDGRITRLSTANNYWVRKN